MVLASQIQRQLQSFAHLPKKVSTPVEEQVSSLFEEDFISYIRSMKDTTVVKNEGLLSAAKDVAFFTTLPFRHSVYPLTLSQVKKIQEVAFWSMMYFLEMACGQMPYINKKHEDIFWKYIEKKAAMYKKKYPTFSFGLGEGAAIMRSVLKEENPYLATMLFGEKKMARACIKQLSLVSVASIVERAEVFAQIPNIGQKAAIETMKIIDDITDYAMGYAYLLGVLALTHNF